MRHTLRTVNNCHGYYFIPFMQQSISMLDFRKSPGEQLKDQSIVLDKRPIYIYHFGMNNISISQLKINPAKFIGLACDYPIAVEKRNKIQAYLVGKNLFEKIVDYLENHSDQKTIAQTDFKKGRDFEEVASQLGI